MLAQNLENIQKKGLPGFKFTDIGSVFGQDVLRYVFAIAGILLLVYLLFAGLQFMFARGDPKAIQAARSKITNALVGFIIVFLAFWITQLFGTVLNIKAITDIFK